MDPRGLHEADGAAGAHSQGRRQPLTRGRPGAGRHRRRGQLSLLHRVRTMSRIWEHATKWKTAEKSRFGPAGLVSSPSKLVKQTRGGVRHNAAFALVRLLQARFAMRTRIFFFASLDFCVVCRDPIGDVSPGSETQFFSLSQLAIAELIGAGLTFSVAAGNDAADACAVSPARLSAAVTVGAVNISDVSPGAVGHTVTHVFVCRNPAKHDASKQELRLRPVSRALVNIRRGDSFLARNVTEHD